MMIPTKTLLARESRIARCSFQTARALQDTNLTNLSHRWSSDSDSPSPQRFRYSRNRKPSQMLSWLRRVLQQIRMREANKLSFEVAFVRPGQKVFFRGGGFWIGRRTGTR